MTVELLSLATVREALLHARDSLVAAGIPDAHIEAELLLGHFLGVPNHHLYAFPGQELTLQQVELLNGALDRRLDREPLAYILGHREFYDIDMVVEPGVLIPRPETEMLVELVLALSRGRHSDKEVSIAEPGTGCGAISICLAKHLPKAKVFATDTSEKALRIAKHNVQQLDVGGQVTLMKGDLLRPVPEKVDIIVANLPYIPTDQIPGLQPEVRWEPREALDGGIDGLETMMRMLNQATDKIREDGAIILEMDPGQVRSLKDLANKLFPAATVTVEQDLGHLDRVLAIQLGPGAI